MKLLSGVLDLLYPRRAVCISCGTMLGCDRDDVCETCREDMASRWVGVFNTKPKLGLDGAAAAYAYGSPAGALVRSLKYGGMRVLTEEMSRDLARAVEGLKLEGIDAVVSVPMHPKRMRTREFNHAELLARGAAAQLGLPYEDLLVRTRNAPQQARLSQEARTKNLTGGFGTVRPAEGMRILLIDDVFTTGSTAKFCAEALRAAGAERVYFAAYALGEKGK